MLSPSERNARGEDAMPKFTPGPWSIFQPANETHRSGITADHNNSDVIIYGLRDDDDAGIHGESPEEEIANAHLIAAAPEMYDALIATRNLLKAFVGPDDTLGQSVLSIACASLAKAEGR